MTSEILGRHIWQKKTRKFEIATNCVNQIFNLKALYFFLLTGATYYYHTVYLVSIYFASFIDYKITFLKVFQIGTFKDPNLAGKKNNKFGGKSFKKITPRSS